jgi:hypothetical protein
MSARTSFSHKGCVEVQTRHVVELVLPAAKLECRPVATFRSRTELDLATLQSMAALLGWKPTSPRCAGATCFPIYPMKQEPLPEARFMLAHFDDPGSAEELTKRLNQLLQDLNPPWSETTRAIFLHGVQEAVLRS